MNRHDRLADRDPARHIRHRMPVLVAVVGLLVTIAATFQIDMLIAGRDEERFEAWVERTHANVQERTQARLARLQTLTIGLLGGDEGAFSPQFLQHTQEFIEDDAAVRAIGVAAEMMPGGDAAPADGPPQHEPEFTSIRFQQSTVSAGLTLRRLDFDNEPAMRQAMAQALAAQEPVTSRQLYAPGSDEAGPGATVIFIPVRFGEDSADGRAQLAPFRGCVYAMLDTPAMWETSLPSIARLTVTVYDGPEADPQRVLWWEREGGPPRRGSLQQTRGLTVAGRPYTIRFTSTPAFEAGSLRWPVVPVTLAVGLLLTAGLTFLVASQTRAWRAARGLSDELQESQRKLEETNATLEHRVAERTAVAAGRAAQLQRLAGQLMQAEQRERRRLARVLHDHLQQLLVAAKMQIPQARQTLGESKAEHIEGLLNEAIDVSRSLTVELSPPVLYSRGLVAAIEWLGRQSERKHQLKVRLHADEAGREHVDARMDENVREFLFDAVRELLFNVAKYASVDEADVSVEWVGDEGKVRVVVADQGVGFDAASRPSDDGESGGFGLFSVQERLQLLGGTMMIESAPGRGTKVTLIVPAGRGEGASSGAGREAATKQA